MNVEDYYIEIKVNKEEVYYNSTEELTFLKTQQFATREELDTEKDVYTKDILKGKFNGEPISLEIPIEYLEGVVQKVKEAGANFISIDFHGDHVEYDIYGYKITRASVEESIADDEWEKARMQEKLESEIKQLENRINVLKQQK